MKIEEAFKICADYTNDNNNELAKALYVVLIDYINKKEKLEKLKNECNSTR